MASRRWLPTSSLHPTNIEWSTVLFEVIHDWHNKEAFKIFCNTEKSMNWEHSTLLWPVVIWDVTQVRDAQIIPL